MLSDFDDFFINTREINTLNVKDYALIEIIIQVAYYINNIKLKLIDSIKTLRLLLRIFFFKDNIKEISRTLIRDLSRYFEILILL